MVRHLPCEWCCVPLVFLFGGDTFLRLRCVVLPFSQCNLRWNQTKQCNQVEPAQIKPHYVKVKYGESKKKRWFSLLLCGGVAILLWCGAAFPCWVVLPSRRFRWVVLFSLRSLMDCAAFLSSLLDGAAFLCLLAVVLPFSKWNVIIWCSLTGRRDTTTHKGRGRKTAPHERTRRESCTTQKNEERGRERLLPIWPTRCVRIRMHTLNFNIA